MKIAIVDDDMQMHKHLRTHLNEQLGDSCEVIGFSSGEEFLSVWEKSAFDLIILDIFMDKLTGINVADTIRKTDQNVRIVFSSTSNEFASESYEVNACYYLHKPFGGDQIKAMLERINIAEIERMKTAKLPDGTNIVLRNVLYADFASHRVTLHCKYSDNTVIRASFSQIESLLCSYPYFFSPCKGVVVNFYEVVSQTGNTFTMSDGRIIPISRRKSKDVLEAYSSFRFDLLRKGGEQ